MKAVIEEFFLRFHNGAEKERCSKSNEMNIKSKKVFFKKIPSYSFATPCLTEMNNSYFGFLFRNSVKF